jgi:hypothetical protein
MRNKTSDFETRPLKFRLAELLDSAILAGCCYSFASPPAGGRMGGVVMIIIGRTLPTRKKEAEYAVKSYLLN